MDILPNTFLVFKKMHIHFLLTKMPHLEQKVNNINNNDSEFHNSALLTMLSVL